MNENPFDADKMKEFVVEWTVSHRPIFWMQKHVPYF